MNRRLTRNRRDAMCAGVAAGFADYFDVDPVLVRLGFVLLTFAGGAGIPFYLICWVIMPPGEERPAGPASASDRVAEEVRAVGEQARAAGQRVVDEVREVHESGRGRLIGGITLIALGSILLLERLSWMVSWPYWLRWGNVWPLLLVAIGVMLILRSREEEA
jgi:phage shock protein C